MEIAKLIRKPIAWVIGAMILALAAWWLIAALTGGSRAKTEAKLNRNVAGAALDSGSDAVGTMGEQHAAEVAADALTRENDHDIRNARGADAPVDPAASAAGLRSLCKRAAYRQRPECLQYASTP